MTNGIGNGLVNWSMRTMQSVDILCCRAAANAVFTDSGWHIISDALVVDN